MMLPFIGQYGACMLTAKSLRLDADWPVRTRWQRLAHAILGAALAGLTMYLAFVITSRIWHANELSAPQSAFWYQVFHPSVLPPLSQQRPGGPSLDQTWFGMPLVGFFVGALVTYWVIGRSWVRGF
jgi:hypothetical protein